jgi:hypothetical protein
MAEVETAINDEFWIAILFDMKYFRIQFRPL